MELIAYSAMAVGAAIALGTKKPAIIYGWLGLFVIYAVAARLAPELTGDMRRYYEAASRWPGASLYTLREPVLWYGSAGLYALIGSKFLVFLAIDLMNAILVFYSLKRLDGGDFRTLALGPTILSSYVVVLGQQNGYRQYTSFVVFLCSIAVMCRSRTISATLFALSFATHNVSAIFFGYWVGSSGNRTLRIGPVITLAGVVLLGLLWPYLRKSASYTGLDTSYWYVLLVAGIVSVMIFVRNGRFPSYGGLNAIYNFLAFAPAIAVLASDQFERISMYFLILIIIDLNRNSRALRVRLGLIQLVSYSILVPPVFFFVNVYSKLL